MHRILVVDDEEGIRKNIERLLTLEGYEVATAPNGHHGLVIARSMLPDIVITDINMPVMDGYGLVKKIKEELKLSTPTVAVTAFAIQGDRENLLLAGFDGYVSKPIDIGELEKLLDTYFKN